MIINLGDGQCKAKKHDQDTVDFSQPGGDGRREEDGADAGASALGRTAADNIEWVGPGTTIERHAGPEKTQRILDACSHHHGQVQQKMCLGPVANTKPR